MRNLLQDSGLVDISGRLAIIRQMRKLKEDLTSSRASQEHTVLLAEKKTKAGRQLRGVPGPS